MKSTRVFKSDVLLNITGGSIGRSCVYDLDNHANVNQHVCIIRLNEKMLKPQFLTYFLNSPLGQNVISSSQNEGNRQSLTFVQIGSFKIPMPSIDEQETILQKISDRVQPIEKISVKLTEEIALLNEYRTRLIADVVTGKKDVSGVVVPKYEVVEDTTQNDDVVEDENDEDNR